MRPTVHDIAASAGVSLATVDRVLNRRPGVRAATRAKVEAAIDRLGYVRDVAAANLAKGRVYPLVFILPDSNNSFMHGLHAEVREAIARAAAERTDIRVIEIPAFDPAALVVALDAARAERLAGVALVAIDADEVRDAVARLAEKGVPVVTLVSDLPGSRRDHYAGVDNIAAGRTAASLLGRFLGGRAGPVAVLAGSMLVRDHRERLEGFAAVRQVEFPGITILPVLEGRDEPQRAQTLGCATPAAPADLPALYRLRSGNRGPIAPLQTPGGAAARRRIAHELTVHTRAALQDGVIDAVLNQDAGHEVRSAIRILKAKADGLAVVEAQERIRIDIFLRDNLP